jgi:hypothetical protein
MQQRMRSGLMPGRQWLVLAEARMRLPDEARFVVPSMLKKG